MTVNDVPVPTATDDRGSIRRFLEEAVVRDPASSTPAVDLYAAYVAWGTTATDHTYTETAPVFGRRLIELGETRVRRSAGNYYLGIRPKEESA